MLYLVWASHLVGDPTFLYRRGITSTLCALDFNIFHPCVGLIYVMEV